MWVHTGVGLVALEPDTGVHVLYRAYDGVRVGSAIPGVRFRNPESGEILFGGASGLISFQGETLPAPQPPEIIFTSLKKNGREVAHLLLPGEAVHLGRRDRSFSLQFAVLDYLAREDQRFAYRRDKIDDDWVVSENRGLVDYTRYLGLGGEDRLLVRGTSGNGIWREATLEVSFEPPLWITWLPLILPLGLIALIGVIYTLISLREKRTRARLEAKARQAEEKRVIAEERARISERQRELARRERLVQEEHTRILQHHLDRVSTEIANNLHDGPLSKLHGLGFRLREMSRADRSAQPREDLRKVAEESLPEVCHHLRNICGVLLLPDFRDGLALELDAYADVIEGMHPGLTIDRDLKEAGAGWSNEQKAVIYRIFRTLLDNVGKHARATLARVRFDQQSGQLRLRIEDNGCGFEVPGEWETLKQQKHYGMYMADYFTRSMGGRFTVESMPGQGTTITVTVPLG